MKKNYLFLMLFFLICSNVFAQDAKQDVIYLTNGKIVRGTITDQKFNKSVTIETQDKSIFVFEMTEIESIKKERISNAQNDYLIDSLTNEKIIEFTQNGMTPKLIIEKIHLGRNKFDLSKRSNCKTRTEQS